MLRNKEHFYGEELLNERKYSQNTTSLEKMLYSKNETTCFGLYWPSSGFHNTLRRVYKTLLKVLWKPEDGQ